MPRPTTDNTGARQLTQRAERASSPPPAASPAEAAPARRADPEREGCKGRRKPDGRGGEIFFLAHEAHGEGLRAGIGEGTLGDELLRKEAAFLRRLRRRRHAEKGKGEPA